MIPKTPYELCTLLRAEVTAANLQIHTIKVVPKTDTAWTAEYEAEGYRQDQYADQFAQITAGMQSKYYLQK